MNFSFSLVSTSPVNKDFAIQNYLIKEKPIGWTNELMKSNYMGVTPGKSEDEQTGVRFRHISRNEFLARQVSFIEL